MKKQNRYFLIIPCFMLSCIATPHQTKCSSFKTGKFILKSRITGSYSIIDRNDSLQSEISSKTGEKAVAQIKWITPCDYELLYLVQTRNSSDTISKFLQTRPVKVTIVKTGNNFYVFESRVDSVNFIYSDTMFLRQ